MVFVIALPFYKNKMHGINVIKDIDEIK